MLEGNTKFPCFWLTDVWLFFLRDMFEDSFIHVEVSILEVQFQVDVQLFLQSLALPQYFDQILAELVQEAAKKHTKSIWITVGVVLTQQVDNFVQIVFSNFVERWNRSFSHFHLLNSKRN